MATLHDRAESRNQNQSVSVQKKPAKPFSRARKRLRELERIIADRHGVVPDTDDADHYLLPVARCFRKIMVDTGKIISVDEVMNRFGLWCETWAPRLTSDQAADIVGQVLAGPAKFDRDDDLGAMLRLTYAERRRLKITTIGSCDVDRRSRKKLAKTQRRERDRLRAAQKRRANGATPRANSLSRTKPWEQEGISRRTWERRRSRETETDANSSPHLLHLHGRRTCVNESQPWLALGISKSTYYRRRARETQDDESSSPQLVEQPAVSRARQATRRQEPIIVDNHDRDSLTAGWGGVVDRIDDPEHAPYAVAAGATKGPKLTGGTRCRRI